MSESSSQNHEKSNQESPDWVAFSKQQNALLEVMIEQKKSKKERVFSSLLLKILLSFIERFLHVAIFFSILVIAVIATFQVLKNLNDGSSSGQDDQSIGEVEKEAHFSLQEGSQIAVFRLEGGVGNNIVPEDLEKAFETLETAKQVKAVLLWVNSGGGDAIASARIADAIRLLKSKRPNLPVDVFTPGMIASGAYFLAAPADKIYALRSSLIGSIGVYMESKNYSSLLSRYGIKDTTTKAGKYKYESPTVPEDPNKTRVRQELTNDFYEIFKDYVRKGRKGHLSHSISDDELFSGRVWMAKDAKNLGLIDGLASYREVIAKLQEQTASLKEKAQKTGKKNKGAKAKKKNNLPVIRYSLTRSVHVGILDGILGKTAYDQLHGLLALDKSLVQ